MFKSMRRVTLLLIVVALLVAAAIAASKLTRSAEEYLCSMATDSAGWDNTASARMEAQRLTWSAATSSEEFPQPADDDCGLHEAPIP